MQNWVLSKYNFEASRY